MSLQDKVPEKLRLRDSIISITSNEDVGVFPTSEYVLLEISPTAEKINVPKIASTIHALVRNDRRVVAIRGYGFKGIGLAVRVAHELKVREERFRYEMAFDTFDASDKEGKTLTSVQIVVMPPS
jgi:hypothetical protein